MQEYQSACNKTDKSVEELDAFTREIRDKIIWINPNELTEAVEQLLLALPHFKGDPTLCMQYLAGPLTEILKNCLDEHPVSGL